MAGSVCVVTVHGIGFQRAPDDANGVPGYADTLHQHLGEILGDRLGTDPERTGVRGPVYVCSEWAGSPAQGLARLLDPDKPLAEAGKIAHVALVYSPSESLDSHLGETADALARAAISHNHYASTIGTLRLVLSDAWAALHEDSHGASAGAQGEQSTLRPRADLRSPRHQGVLAHLLKRGDQASGSPRPATSAGGFNVLRALEDDIATYVASNELRERVRGFVQDALLGLLARRGDVSAIVINAHSQGTVLCWDVLCRLPFSTWVRERDARAGRIPHFVTAGSPIRKYVDMFSWGNQVGELAAVLPSGTISWSNFFDPRDPVADPLNPPVSWRPGQPWDQPVGPEDGLLLTRDFHDGRIHHATVSDHDVNNIEHSSGGGLQAHDYWENTTDFIPALASILTAVGGHRG